ncbi:hypothetical protein PSAC2689_90048 [Paraburkholderia sacchari]
MRGGHLPRPVARIFAILAALAPSRISPLQFQVIALLVPFARDPGYPPCPHPPINASCSNFPAKP